MNEQKVMLQVSDSTVMQAHIARPAGEAPRPGLIVLQEAFGVNRHIRDVARRFAEQGYCAIAPELFHRTAPPGFEGDYGDFPSVMPHVNAVVEKTAEPDLRAAFDWLQAQPLVRRDEISCLGFCMGGRLAFLANAVLPLRAAVSYYGGGIAAQFLDRAPALRAPILFFWGEKDKHIPPEQRRQITDALKQHGKTFVNVEFSDADHGFFCDQRASYHAAAARQSWALTLEFLRAS